MQNEQSRALATRPASIGTPGRHRSESVADIASERPAEIIGIRTDHRRPGPLDDLLVKPDLSLEDTRPRGAGVVWQPAIYACGEELGAAYYSWRHNRSEANDTPIIVAFDVEFADVAVDGKDFLNTVFQFGDPARTRPGLERIFGPKVLRYADAAFASADQERRGALCDLATHDPEVIAAHHANTLVIAGRYKTMFRSAFTIAIPVAPERIVAVWSPDAPPSWPEPDIRLNDVMMR
jgi:hypothetical protein